MMSPNFRLFFLLKAMVVCCIMAFAFSGEAEAKLPKANECSALNQPACPLIYKGEPCDAGLDEVNGKCRPCGGENERACAKIKRGYPCEGKLEPDSTNICRPCGGDGEKACRALKSGTQCDSGLFNDGGSCNPCGGADQKACPKILRGYPCDGAFEPNDNNICKPCGGANEKACRALKEGKRCESGLTVDGDVCKPCGAEGEIACPIAMKGHVCDDGLGNIGGICEPCGKKGIAACPWTEHGRQCEAGTTESDGVCTPCGAVGQIACKITDRGKTCQLGAKREDGQCVGDIGEKVYDRMKEEIGKFAQELLDMALAAGNVDRNDIVRNSILIAEVNRSKTLNSEKGGDNGAGDIATFDASDLPDNNACLGDSFQSWSVGVGAGGVLLSSGVSGEAGLAFRCADWEQGQKDAKWYSSGALNSQLGANASAGVTLGMWKDAFNNLSGDSHGYTLNFVSALGLIKALSVSTALLDSLDDTNQIQPEMSVGMWFERERDDEVGRFLGMTVTISGGVGIDAGGVYSQAKTKQFED